MPNLKPIIPPPPGSIVLFSGRGFVPWVIELGTCSKFSHGAHVCRITKTDLVKYRPVRKWRLTDEQVANWQDGIYLIESTTLGDKSCVIQGKPFSGVQVHRYDEYVRSYQGKVWVMRLVDPMTAEESQLLTDLSLDSVGTPYDFAGAGLAWTRVLKRLCFWRTADRRTQYCIENLLTCELFALRGRVLPKIDPGEATPGYLEWIAGEWGLFKRPELAHDWSVSA
jgi:hypothetical protein